MIEIELGQTYTSINELIEICHNIYDELPHGMIILNNQKQVVYLNNKCSEIAGFSKEEMMTWNFTNFIKLLDNQDYNEVNQLADRKLSESNMIFNKYVLKFKHKSKGYAWISIYSKSIRIGSEMFIIASIVETLPPLENNNTSLVNKYFIELELSEAQLIHLKEIINKFGIKFGNCIKIIN